MSLKTELLALLIMSIFSADLFCHEESPEKISLSITLGLKQYSYNSIPTFPEHELKPYFVSSGNQNNGSFGISLNYKFKNISNDFSIITKLYYDNFNASFDHYGSVWPHAITGINNAHDTISVATAHYLKIDYSLITGAFLVKYNIWGNLGVFGGPTIGYVVYNHALQKYIIESPSNVKFKDIKDWNPGELPYHVDSQEAIVQDGEIRDVSYFNVGLQIGFQYEINIYKLWFVPYVSQGIPITNISNAAKDGWKTNDWKINNTRAGIDIRYEL